MAASYFRPALLAAVRLAAAFFLAAGVFGRLLPNEPR